MKLRDTGLLFDLFDWLSEIARDSAEDCLSIKSRDWYASSSMSLASFRSKARYTPGECGINKNLLLPARLVTGLPSLVMMFFRELMLMHSSRLLKSVSRRQFSHENSSYWLPLTFDNRDICLESPNAMGCDFFTARHVASFSFSVIWQDNLDASTYSLSLCEEPFSLLS